MTQRLRNKDVLGALALIAALIATASAEYELARAVGFGEFTAGCVPAALDVYALRAIAARRDVAAVVAALIVTNSLAHLVSAGALAVSIPLVIAVSAIAPLVLWRVKALSAPTAPLSGPESAPEATPEGMGQRAPERPAETLTEVPRPASATQSAHAPAQPADPLLPKARQMQADAGRVPTLRALQSELRVGQARAQRIRAALAA